MTGAILATGGGAQLAFDATPPGVVDDDVVVALARHVPAEVFAEHAGAHQGAVGLAKQVTGPLAACHLVGITERGEVQQAELPGALAGGDCLFAGGAAEDHLRTLAGETLDIVPGVLRARGTVAGQ
ncbi:hypothetical protein D3C80_1358850 [compost metagenome]